MAATPTTLAALRSMLAARFPETNRRATGLVPTGVHAIDDILGGGLPAGKVTELVSTRPGTGGQTVLAQLLRTTRTARQRVALIDGANGFAPQDLPPDALRHLVWIRGGTVMEAFAAADILARDGNYAVVVFDLRGLPERALLKTPVTVWHRLRQATEGGPVALLVQSSTPLVPAVPWRLVLGDTLPLAARTTERAELANALCIAIARGHVDEEKSA